MMGLWKNAGVSTCLQYDYGFSRQFAELQANAVDQLGFLPGTEIPTKNLKKQEIAAWLAVTACMPPNGMKCNDPGYIRHVQLVIEQQFHKGKITVPMYRELEECFEIMSDPELVDTLTELYNETGSETEAQLSGKLQEAAEILQSDYFLTRETAEQHISVTSSRVKPKALNPHELAAITMIMSVREQGCTDDEAIIILGVLQMHTDQGRYSKDFQKLVDQAKSSLVEQTS
jgi:hypothetical protein